MILVKFTSTKLLDQCTIGLLQNCMNRLENQYRPQQEVYKKLHDSQNFFNLC